MSIRPDDRAPMRVPRSRVAPGASAAGGVGSATSLRRAWVALPQELQVLEPLEFSPERWSLIERLRAHFDDREVHTRLPMPIARFGDAAREGIYELAKQLDDVETRSGADHRYGEHLVDGRPDAMAEFARRFDDEVDAIMGVLVPAARHRKGHYAYGRFTVPVPHGLHTDHSAEDPGAGGEPICIARIAALGTHYVAGDDRAHDPETRRMLQALRHWVAVPEGEPEQVLDALLRRGTLQTIPVDHVVLMVAGNGSAHSQITQHIAARPPEGGVHSALFQRQYKLV